MFLRCFSYYKDYKSIINEKERNNKKGEAMPLPNDDDDIYIKQT